MAENDMVVSIEDYNKLKDSQSGSDRANTILRQEKEAWLKEKSELELKINNVNNNKDEEYQKRNILLDRKQRVIEMALEKGISPEKAFDLMGLTNMDDEERLDLYLQDKEEIRFAVKDEYAKTHGRRDIHNNYGLSNHSLSYSELNNMTDKQIQQLPGDAVNRVIDKEMKSQKRLSAKQRLTGRI